MARYVVACSSALPERDGCAALLNLAPPWRFRLNFYVLQGRKILTLVARFAVAPKTETR
jgi:hypothetical protein